MSIDTINLIFAPSRSYHIIGGVHSEAAPNTKTLDESGSFIARRIFWDPSEHALNVVIVVVSIPWKESTVYLLVEQPPVSL